MIGTVGIKLAKYQRTRRPMKLIVSNLETLRTYVSREFYYTLTDLINTYGWKHIEIHKLWGGAGTVRDNLLAEFGELPENILFWEAYEFLLAHAPQIQRLNCHKCFFADDLHWWNQQMREMKLVSFAICDSILASYAYVWDGYYPQLSGMKKAIWVPHSASPDFMLSYNHAAENCIFLSGAMNEAYPLRQQMLHLRSELPHSIAYHRHPGYYCGYDYEADADIGRGYARKLNSYRTGFTDSLTYKYVVAKYFEIPATGALLLADDAVSGPLRELGFIENEHYLPVSKENLEERVQYVLDPRNHERLDKIRERGQALVWERHKTSDRARQMNEVCSS
jgi:hypothetical protein